VVSFDCLRFVFSTALPLRQRNALINLLSGISKFCPPAAENDADRILSVGFVVSKTEVCAYNQKPTNFQHKSQVFENFLSTTEKLRTSFSFAGEQFQASRKKSFPLSRRFKDRKFEKTKLALFLRKNFIFLRPCEAAWGPGNRNPGTFRSFGYKRTSSSIRY